MDISFVSLALSGATALREHFGATSHVLQSATQHDVNNYALPWTQCGGKHYRGHTRCTPGHVCKHLNDWWSQCVPDPSLKGPPTYSQCGGKGFDGETKCRDGDMCVVLSKYYSQCVPMVMPAQYTDHSCTNVNVVGDATYCIKGPVCGGEEGGHKCPKKGDVAVGNCLRELKSYVAFAKCVAPKDAKCQLAEFGEYVCAFSKLHVKAQPVAVAVANASVPGSNATVPVLEPLPIVLPDTTSAPVNETESVPVPKVLPAFNETTDVNATLTETDVIVVPATTNSTAALEGAAIVVPVNTTAAPALEGAVIVVPVNTTATPVLEDDVIIVPANTTATPVHEDDVIVVPANTTATPTLEDDVIVVPANTTATPVHEDDVIVVPANTTAAPALEDDVIVVPTTTAVPASTSPSNGTAADDTIQLPAST